MICPILSDPVPRSPDRCPDCKADFDERAAIVEYMGKLPRPWAEGVAKDRLRRRVAPQGTLAIG